jgi:hypothetical protein
MNSKSPAALCYMERWHRQLITAKKQTYIFFRSRSRIGPMSKNQESLIAADGLRYKTKEGGSPFKDSGSMASISCYKCGLHKPRAMGTFKKLINQRMFMCGDCISAKSA